MVLLVLDVFFFFKQMTAFKVRISDLSSDVCSADLEAKRAVRVDHDFQDQGIGESFANRRPHRRPQHQAAPIMGDRLAHDPLFPSRSLPSVRLPVASWRPSWPMN